MKAKEMAENYVQGIQLSVLFEADLLSETREIIKKSKSVGHSAIMGACKTQADKWGAFIRLLDKKKIKHRIKPISELTIFRSL